MAQASERRAWECDAWLDDDGYVLIKVESLDPSVDRPEALFALAAKRKLRTALASWGMHSRTAQRKATRADFEEWDHDEDWATGFTFVRVYRTTEPVAAPLLNDDDLEPVLETVG